MKLVLASSNVGKLAELREQHGGDGAKQAVLDRLEAWIDGVAAEIGA